MHPIKIKVTPRERQLFNLMFTSFLWAKKMTSASSTVIEQSWTMAFFSSNHHFKVTLKTHPKEGRKEFVGCKSSNGCSLRKGKKDYNTQITSMGKDLALKRQKQNQKSEVSRVKQRSKPLF